MNSYFGVCLKDSNTQAQIRDHLTCEMKKKLQNQDQEKLFIPDYGVGCRRPTPGVKYIESLTAENAEIVLGDIREVTANGVVDHHGKEHCFDILVCATGFDTSYKPRFPLVGLKGQNLQVEWSKDVKAYLAIAAPDMPNYFVFYGPNNPFASGAFLATVGMLVFALGKVPNVNGSQNFKRSICSSFVIAGKQRIFIRSHPRWRPLKTFWSTPHR